MSKKSTIPQERHHLMIYQEDWEFLESYCRDRAGENLSPGVVIREMVHKRIMALREKINQAIDTMPATGAAK